MIFKIAKVWLSIEFMTMISKKLPFLIASSALFIFSFGCLSAFAQAQGAQAASPGPVAKAVGTVKQVSGKAITLTTEAGSEIDVQVQDSTRLVKTAPGEKDLKGATPIQLQDVQVGDRVLARGTASGDGKSIMASMAIIMKQTDIADKQQHEREDWQKRGVGGVVKSIDPATGTITISNAGKSVAVTTSKTTTVRRYSPDSVKFDDAKIATIDKIKAGDQLRARGERNPDATQVSAEEIVSGTFRNIAGTVTAVDPTKNTVSILDLLTKKPILIQLTTDSQLRKLPIFVAQRIAMRLKGESPEGASGGGPLNAGNSAGASGSPASNNGAGSQGGAGSRQSGGADFQQVLSRMPEFKIADLQKGDAVIAVATQGTDSSAPSAITLLSGVEALLTASPSAASVLSPWSLSSGGDMGAQ